MEKIEHEQHLLELYYQAERSVINERSSSIVEDTHKLNKQVLEYVAENNLNGEFVDEEAGVQF